MITKIYGPPGTGKTTLLIDIVKSEIGKGVVPSEIVYCSFTRVAARVARRRILLEYPNYNLYDFKNFNTIHGICFHLLGLQRSNVLSDAHLRKFGQMYNHKFSDEFSIDNGFNESLTDIVMQTRADCAEHFVNWYKNRLIFDIEEAYRQFQKQIIEFPDGFSKSYLAKYLADRDKYKRDNYLWDFPDMIIACIENNIYPLEMKVLILDEAQDSFPAQFELIRRWSRIAERTYIAGDAYQAIYTFSGANPELMINFYADETIVLKNSYRCPRSVSSLASTIRRKFKLRYEDDEFIPRDHDGTVIHGGFRYVPGVKTFYIARTRYIVDSIRNKLISAGIPFYVRRGRPNIFSSERKLDAVRAMIQLVDGYDVPLEIIVKLLDFIPSRKLIKHGAKSEIRSLFLREPHLVITKKHLKELGFTDTFISHLSDYDNAVSLLVGTHFSQNDASYIYKVIGTYGTQVLMTKPTLEIGTIHSVKGDESDIVVIDPTYTQTPWINLMHNNDEEHRIMYVAVTRSRDVVVITTDHGFKYYPL